MRASFRIFALWCALLLLSASPHGFAQTPTTDANARVIVKLKTSSKLLGNELPTTAAQRDDLAKALGQRVGLTLSAGAGVAERTQVVFASGTSEQLAQRLSAESDIEYAVPDQRRHHTAAPNDPLYLSGPPVSGTTGGPVVGQWYLRAPAGEVQSSINAEPAWNLVANASTVVVAMIDTGVRFDHVDLQRVAVGGNLLPGYDMISDVATANDGDGRDADPSDPGDWVTQAESQQRGGAFNGCTVENSSWHGTQTSGLIGALTNNGIGMASVGRNVRLLPVRVLGKCGGFDSDIIAGMRWAVGLGVPGVPANANPARVLNLSLGGDGACSSAYVDAVAQITAAGAVVVVAAGNGGGHAVGAPANCAGVIAVAGLRHAGDKVGFSDLGSEIALSAPGGNCVNTATTDPCLYPILTISNSGVTAPIADATSGSIYTDSFNASLGTSFSAPLVTGTVALMLAVQPTLTPAQVRATLQANSRPFPTTGGSSGTPQCTAPQPIGATQVDQLECYCTTSTCGAGMLDAGAALLAASGGAPLPTTPTGLTVDTVSSSMISLIWNPSTDNGGPGLAGYSVERCSGSGCASFVPIGSSVSTSTYIDPGLTSGTSFTYRVRAFDLAGNYGGYSNSVATVTLLAGALGTLLVTEFYHQQFDHYFITADPAEAASLAAGNLPPWVPTGKTFKVWDSSTTNITNVCRFFSAAFAPKSSHFYSNSLLECPGLQAGGTWVLENLNAFYMMSSPAGTCPSGTIPLYRLYNNGQGSAPNHRYTIDPGIRTSLITANWIPEGNGTDGVFACVPG